MYRTFHGQRVADSTKSATRIPYFSNPDINYPGTNIPLGDETHNSAKIIRDRRFAMAAVGDESGTCQDPNNDKIKICLYTDNNIVPSGVVNARAYKNIENYKESVRKIEL